jgi:hypothetical protein
LFRRFGETLGLGLRFIGSDGQGRDGGQDEEV